MADANIKPSSKKTIAGCNFVAQDQIWKDHIKLEESAAKLWPRNWDFLTTKYEDLVKDESPKKTETKQELPPHLQPPPVTPIEKYISVGPSPKPVPATTAKMIGWRSGLPDLQLERYGKYANPKGGLVKQFNWPAEAVE